jgi:glucans biosynthesis protein C
MKRLHYIDNLRILLSILVVLHHVSIGYGAMGGWCYVSPDKLSGMPQLIISALFGIEATFSMSLFFFISAYLTTASLEKRGARKFMKNQFLRLGTPLLAVVLILDPLLRYFIAVYKNKTTNNLFKYVWNFLTQNNLNASHLWFVLALLIFESIYVLYYKYSKVSVSKLVKDKLPSHLQILLFILACGILVFLSRQVFPIGKQLFGMNLGNFVLYVVMYGLGILVKRKNWLSSISHKVVRLWFYISLPLLPLLGLAMYKASIQPDILGHFLGGMHWECLALSFWEPVVCFSISAFLIVIFEKLFNYTNSYLKWMTTGRYTVYIIHPIFVVGTTMLFEPYPLPALYKFIIASFVSTFTCFFSAYYIKQLPVLNKVL